MSSLINIYPGLPYDFIDTIAFHFVGNHHIHSKNIVAHNISPDDSSKEGASVGPNPHIKHIVLNSFPDLLDDFDHVQGHVNDILAFLRDVAIVYVVDSHDDVAVSDGVDFVDISLETLLVEVRH